MSKVIGVDVQAVVFGAGGGGPQIWWDCVKKKKKKKKLPRSVCLIVLTSHTLLSPQSCHAYPGSLISKEHHSFLQQEGMRRRRRKKGGGGGGQLFGQS